MFEAQSCNGKSSNSPVAVPSGMPTAGFLSLNLVVLPKKVMIELSRGEFTASDTLQT